MSITARLQKATQSLTPHQRAVLVLQATREGRDPDRDLWRFEDETQRRAFNRYMALFWVANQHLGSIAGITAYRVELAENAAHYFELFNEVAGLFEEEQGLKPTRGTRNWRTKDVVTVPEFLRSLALEARDNAVQQVEHLWKETLALEAVTSDLAEEFAGEDILVPEQRQRIVETQARLKEAAKKVGLRKLPNEAGDEVIQVYRSAVEDSFRQLGYVEG